MITEQPFVPNGAHQQDTTISAATPLTPPSGATLLLIQAFTANVRYTLDGTTPTATLGFQLKAADPPRIIVISSATIIKVIEEAINGVIQFQWGGYGYKSG